MAQARIDVRHRPELSRGRLGRRRRAADLHHRLVLSSRRSRDPVPAEAGAGLRCRLQCLHHVRRPAQGRLPRHGCAALRGHRDGGDDGLCRRRSARRRRSGRGRQGASSATPTTRRRTTSAGAGARHDAARPDRLCRLDAARRRDVRRDLPRRGPDRAGRLFRPRGDRYARRLPALSRSRRRRPPGVRLDTHGGRFIEGLDPRQSYAVLERTCRSPCAAIATIPSCAT